MNMEFTPVVNKKRVKREKRKLEEIKEPSIEDHLQSINEDEEVADAWDDDVEVAVEQPVTFGQIIVEQEDQEDQEDVEPVEDQADVEPVEDQADDQDWPSLNASAKWVPKKGGRKGTSTFVVSHSRIEELKRNRAQKWHQHDPNDPVSRAFATLQDKKAMSERLKGTKPCYFVTPKEEGGDFGVCFRHKCDFAHSLDTWNPPSCTFDSVCRNFGSEKSCNFFHPSLESVDEFLDRTGREKPNLPPTCEHSRKPKPIVKPLGRAPQSTLRTPARKLDLGKSSTSSAPKVPSILVPTSVLSATPTKTVLRIPATKLQEVIDTLSRSGSLNNFDLVVV